mmetsp:Transcript_20392/g.17705  ORF Transcript_20392/g.17705 Transcript_20392/m.17705 type:complete len:205 (-) Transcript_20392:2256-2870(-)
MQTELQEKIISYWKFEKQLSQATDAFMKNLGIILETAGWNQKPELFIKGFGAASLDSLKTDALTSKNLHLNLPLQRSLINFLQYTLERIHLDNITKQLEFIESYCPGCLKHLLGQPCAAIGLMRAALVKNKYDFQKNPVVMEYFKQNPGISIFDIDFTFVQLFSLTADGENDDLFEIYFNNFFGYDEKLLNMFRTADFKLATPY